MKNNNVVKGNEMVLISSEELALKLQENVVDLYRENGEGSIIHITINACSK